MSELTRRERDYQSAAIASRAAKERGDRERVATVARTCADRGIKIIPSRDGFQLRGTNINLFVKSLADVPLDRLTRR